MCGRDREREREEQCIRNSGGETKETLVVNVLERKAKTACVGWVCSTEYC